MEKAIQNATIQVPSQIHRKQEYTMYVLWCALPARFKNPPFNGKVQMTHAEFANSIGIDSPEIIELMSLKNKTQFSQRFKVERSSMMTWDKYIAQRDPFEDLRLWGVHLIKNVSLASYNHYMRNGNAANGRLFLETMGWTSKSDQPPGGPLPIGDKTQGNVNNALLEYLTTQNEKARPRTLEAEIKAPEVEGLPDIFNEEEEPLLDNDVVY